MSNSSAGRTNGSRGEVWPLVALPRFVAHSAAVEALEVDLPHGAVQHGQLMHVLGSQSDRLNKNKVLDFI